MPVRRTPERTPADHHRHRRLGCRTGEQGIDAARREPNLAWPITIRSVPADPTCAVVPYDRKLQTHSKLVNTVEASANPPSGTVPMRPTMPVSTRTYSDSTARPPNAGKPSPNNGVPGSFVTHVVITAAQLSGAAVHRITARATDFLRGDVAVKGGITALVKAAHLAEAFHMNLEVHHGGNSLNNVANLHVLMAIKNCEFFEVLLPAAAQKYGLAEDIEVDGQGLVHAMNGPGLGAAIDFAFIEREKLAVLT